MELIFQPDVRQTRRILGILLSIILTAVTITTAFDLPQREAYGAFSVKKDTFDAITGSGNQVIAGVGFQPKALILWTDRQEGGSGPAITDGYQFAIGFATSAADAVAASVISDDNVGASNAGRSFVSGDLLRILSNGNPTLERVADLVSFDNNGFTINWSASGVDARIHYLALGGSDITAAKAGTFNRIASTGNQDVTTVGFQGDFVMFLQTNGGGSSAVHAPIGIGFAKSSTERGALFVDSEDGEGTMDTWRYQRSDRCIVSLQPNSGAVDDEADFVSWLTNGFTINWTNAPSGTPNIGYLVLKGGQFKVGSFQITSGTGNQPISGVGFQPVGLILMSDHSSSASPTTSEAHNRLVFGAAHTTGDSNEGNIAVGDEDGADPSITARSNRQTKIMHLIDEVATGSSSTIDLAADLASFDTDGFTLNKTTNTNNTLAQVIYVAFGNAPVLQDNDVQNPSGWMFMIAKDQ
ncbi:MAG: hypothetical protein ACRD38_00270 [Nitrososphaerales archaeon]